MAPSKRPRNNAAVVPALGAGEPGEVQTKALNVDIMAKVKEAWNGLMSQDDFHSIQKESPLQAGKGGCLHATDFKLIKVQNLGHKYTAGGNAAWANPFWSPCSVPLINSAISSLINGRWRKPASIEITIAVCSHSDPTKDQTRFKSQLKRISPEEEHVAFILSTWRDVSKGEYIEEWKACWLSASFTWLTVADDAESCFWEAAKIREKIGESYETLYYTPVQRIFQIGAVKKLLQDKGGEQAVSVKVLKRHFDQNLEIKSGEAATEHMIQTAIALWNSLFSVPRLKELAFLMDETFGKMSPLDTVAKLESIMRSCRSNNDHLEWCLIQMADLCLNRKVSPQEMQPTYLFGAKGQPKGMIHVWLWKLQSKPKLLALLDQHLPPEDAVQIRKSLQNHESFRVHYGGRPFTAEAIKENLKVPDGQQWIACMDPRSQKAAEFGSQFLYGLVFDHAIKQAVRHQQPLDEVLERSDIEKIWKQILSPASVAADDHDAEDIGMAKSAALVSLLPSENIEKLNKPENAGKLETIENAVESARKQVKSQCLTIDGSMSLEKLAKMMREMRVCKLRGSHDSSILVLYVLEAAGEHERDSRRSLTPVRRDFMEKVMKAIWSTRASELPDFDEDNVVFPALDPSDVFLYFDGGRAGTQPGFTQLFKSLEGGPYNKHQFHVNYNEDSVKEHRKARSLSGGTLDRGVFNLSQMETIVVIPGCSSRLASVVGSRRNLHFTGSTSGNSLQEVFKNDLKSVPTLPTTDKHAMMQGARLKDDVRATTAAKGLDQPGIEPMDWSALDHRLVEELLHRFRPKAVILATAGCPSIMQPILELQIPCLAVCYSAQHEKWFQENTNKILFRQMCLAKSRHFQPEVAKALKDTGKVDVDAQETNKKQSKHGNRSKSKGAKPKRRSKSGKGRGRGRGGKGKKRKGSELDDDDLDEDDLDGEDDLQEDGEEDQDDALEIDEDAEEEDSI